MRSSIQPCSIYCQGLRLLPPRLKAGVLRRSLINFDLHTSQDQIVKLRFNQLSPGAKRLTAYRIDEDCRWSSEDMELLPYEQRLVDTLPVFEYQFYSPADSVLLVTLDESW